MAAYLFSHLPTPLLQDIPQVHLLCSPHPGSRRAGAAGHRQQPSPPTTPSPPGQPDLGPHPAGGACHPPRQRAAGRAPHGPACAVGAEAADEEKAQNHNAAQGHHQASPVEPLLAPAPPERPLAHPALCNAVFLVHHAVHCFMFLQAYTQWEHIPPSSSLTSMFLYPAACWTAPLGITIHPEDIRLVALFLWVHSKWAALPYFVAAVRAAHPLIMGKDNNGATGAVSCHEFLDAGHPVKYADPPLLHCTVTWAQHPHTVGRSAQERGRVATNLPAWMRADVQYTAHPGPLGLTAWAFVAGQDIYGCDESAPSSCRLLSVWAA
jgi:hypothetical protein